MKPARTFEKKAGTQCGSCGESLAGKPERPIDGVILCDSCNYTLRERGFLHIDEVNGTHTFWVLQAHIKKVQLAGSQYAKFVAHECNLTYLI